MHGFPQAIKDLTATKGIRTTQGSRIFKDFVPTADAIIVERVKRAGSIIIGKTNTPEFGLGSNTYNDVFGRTLNAYDQTKTSGGSTGGGGPSLAQPGDGGGQQVIRVENRHRLASGQPEALKRPGGSVGNEVGHRVSGEAAVRDTGHARPTRVTVVERHQRE